MTLDEAIAHLQQLKREGYPGSTPVIDENNVPFEVAEYNTDDGTPAIVLLFERDSF